MGVIRKAAAYIGLVDDGRYDEYDVEDSSELYALETGEMTQAQIAHLPERITTNEPKNEPQVKQQADISRIVSVRPRSYNEARTIGENFRDNIPVIMNVSDMAQGEDKRLVDFASGLTFGLRGSIERISSRVFLLCPANLVVGPEDKERLATGGFFNQS